MGRGEVYRDEIGRKHQLDSDSYQLSHGVRLLVERAGSRALTLLVPVECNKVERRGAWTSIRVDRHSEVSIQLPKRRIATCSYAPSHDAPLHSSAPPSNRRTTALHLSR